MSCEMGEELFIHILKKKQTKKQKTNKQKTNQPTKKPTKPTKNQPAQPAPGLCHANPEAAPSQEPSPIKYPEFVVAELEVRGGRAPGHSDIPRTGGSPASDSTQRLHRGGQDSSGGQKNKMQQPPLHTEL